MAGKATAVRNEIGPLLDQLIVQLTLEGSATQRAYFDRIRRSLHLASLDTDLAPPILALSTSAAVGFRFSREADALVHRILEKAVQLTGLTEDPHPRIH
ncbi:MAG: hypothetical protein R3E82_17890 [Pseudomonadales bacterium]